VEVLVRQRLAGVLFAAAVVTSGWMAVPVSGQGQQVVTKSVCPDDTPAKFHPCALAAAKAFNPPRTPDGRPDMSGYWRRRAQAFEDLEEHPRNPDDGGGPSVVVDPADGKVPMQAWADARRRENAAKFLHHNAACVLSGAAGTMYMANIYQFLQNRDHFMLIGEGLSAHPFRIVPTDGRPHTGKDLLMWLGDPRGHWEGTTLVIETLHQNGKNYLDQRGRFYTEEARLVERMTMIDANTIHWSATIEDANVYTRPFTIAFPFRRNAVPNTEVWEEACFEDNTEQMQLFRNNGFKVYPGITAREARGGQR
jgi:hypothetical protein